LGTSGSADDGPADAEALGAGEAAPPLAEDDEFASHGIRSA
jgi:hypothetical protein